MRGRSKPESPATPKPVRIPDKLAQPFAESMKAMKAAMEAEAKAEAARAEAEAKAGPRPVVRAASKPGAGAGAGAGRGTPAKSTKPGGRPVAPGSPARSVDPMAHYDYDDRAAFHQAYGDVRPITNPKAAKRRSGQTTPITNAERDARALVAERAQRADDAARERLGALVAGSVRFVLERESDGSVYGRRSDASPRVLDTITGPKVAPTARLDLHGHDAATATRALVQHIRDESARGARVLLVVHGKGLHSEGGVGVLGEVVVKALTESAIAPRVLAFATAAPRLGGLGATVVRLNGA